MIKKLRSSCSFAIAALVILMLLPGIGRGQLLTEPFNYAAHVTDGLAKQSAGVWKKINSGDSIIVQSGNLSFTGFPISLGNSVKFGGAGTDYYTSFSSQTSGTVYMSFLINISSLGSLNTTGGYPIGLLDGGTSNFVSRVFIRLSGTSNFNLGIQPGSIANVSYATNTLSLNTTYLVVISYNFVSGQNNDVARIWINPALGGSEPTSDATVTGAHATTEVTSIQRVFLRQDGTSATPGLLVIDEIRVGTTWASVTPASSIIAPTTQATNNLFSSVASTSFTASWTNGNGTNRAVFIKQANTGTAAPADNATYTGSTSFGSGTQIGSTGWYCVYNGSGTTVNITGLTATTDYMVHVCEYNGAAGSELYNITSSTNNPLTQTTVAGAIAPTITTPTATAIGLTSATLGGDITSNGGSSITERGTVWSLTTPVTITDNKLAEGGTTTGVFTQNRTSLPSGTLIYYAAYATNSVNTTLSTESSFTTLFTEPTNHATAFTAGTATSTSVPLTWTDATVVVIPNGYLIQWNTTGTFVDPVDGIAQANGVGIQNVASGVQTYNVTGLLSNTPYYFKIWSYTNSGTDINYKTDEIVPTANATTLVAPSAVVTSRPSYIDLASATSESAVLMTLSNYSTDDVRFRLYNGTNQYACWDETTDTYITSVSYSDGPRVPGTPTTSSTFWIVSQRGNNNTNVASYRDRLGPTYPGNNLTALLPSATAITTAFTLSGNFGGNAFYDNTIKHVVLAYNGATLVSAAATTLSSGLFSVVCPDGTTIDKIEIRAINNTLIESLTGSWTVSTDIGSIPTTTFTGTGNWSTSGNWSNGIPTSAKDAIIDGNVTIDVAAETKALTINTAKSVTISDTKSLTVNGTLTNSAGISGLVVNSGGSLIQSTPSVLATVKSTIPGGGNTDFHLLSLPITEGINAALPFFDLAYLDKYVEGSGAWTRLVNSDPVASDKGYSINYSTAKTLSFQGTLFNGDKTFGSLGYTVAAPGYGAGWHLAGNPFTSAVNTTVGTWGLTNLDSYIYVWDVATGNFLCTPTQLGFTTLPGNIIPPMQGFFVHANNSGVASITVPQAARVHSTTGFYKSSETAGNALFLTINGNGYGDKALVAFNPSATTGFDGAFDAYKLAGIDAAPQLYSILPGEKAAINTLPDYTTSPNVSLGLKVGASTSYNLTVSGIESFDASLPIRLDDLKTGISQDLRINPVYSFTAAPGDAENRFMLSFASVTGLDKQNASGINVTSTNGIIRVTHNAPVNGTVYLYSVSGQLLATSTLNAGETTLRTSSNGVFLVRVVTGKTSLTRKMVVVQ